MKNYQLLDSKQFHSIKETDIYVMDDLIGLAKSDTYSDFNTVDVYSYLKTTSIKKYFSKYLIKIDKFNSSYYVRGEDFSEIVRFEENGDIRLSFIGGLHDIKLTDEKGNYTSDKLYGTLLSGF